LAAALLPLSSLLLGCVSNQTRTALDRTYESALPEHGKAQTVPSTQKRSRGPVEASSLEGPLTREAVVNRAVSESPALQGMGHRARAMVHAGRAEGSLPSPELMFQAQNLPLLRPYRLGDAFMYMLEFRQRFPAPGSLDARARAMGEEAQAMLSELVSEERAVAERAATAFASYQEASAEKRLLDEQLSFLTRMGEAVRARYSTGGSGLGDVTRISVEVAKVRRNVARVEGALARSRATLNAVLLRPAEAPLGPPEESPPETVRLPLGELLSLAQQNLGDALAADARLRAASARREAAEAEAKHPEFMVGLSYQQDPDMRPGMGVSAAMTLPWLWGPARHRVHQAEEEEAALKKERDDVNVLVQAEVNEAYAMLGAIEAEYTVIRSQALPAARRTLQSLAAAYSTGSASLLEWVDVMRSVLDLEMELVVLNGEFARTVASLERAVGARLPRAALTVDESR
jgi:cobalt-zinc-cadmium efflux system outer membrane protein